MPRSNSYLIVEEVPPVRAHLWGGTEVDSEDTEEIDTDTEGAIDLEKQLVSVTVV